MNDTHQTSPIQSSDLSCLQAPVSHHTPPAPGLLSQARFSPVLAAHCLPQSSDMSEPQAHPVILTMLSGCSEVPLCLQSTPGDHSLSGACDSPKALSCSSTQGCLAMYSFPYPTSVGRLQAQPAVSWEPVTREGHLLLVGLDIQLFEKGVKVRGHHDVVRSQSVGPISI